MNNDTTQAAESTAAPSGLVATATAAANAAEKARKPKAKKADKKAKAAKKAAKKANADAVTGPDVLRQYAPNYVRGGKNGDAKTAAGNKTIDCGDKLADKLRGKTLDEVYSMAVDVLNKALEEGEKPHTVKSLKAKYEKLNVGMQRMNLGNRMRAILFPKQ